MLSKLFPEHKNLQRMQNQKNKTYQIMNDIQKKLLEIPKSSLYQYLNIPSKKPILDYANHSLQFSNAILIKMHETF